MIVVFEDSSIVRARDFNVNNEQVSHILEELSDYLILHKISDETLAFVQNSVEQITNDLAEVQRLLQQVTDTANQALAYLNQVENYMNTTEQFMNNAQTSADMSNEYMQQSQINAEINTAQGYSPVETYNFHCLLGFHQ